jgi:hypothetical protein
MSAEHVEHGRRRDVGATPSQTIVACARAASTTLPGATAPKLSLDKVAGSDNRKSYLSEI